MSEPSLFLTRQCRKISGRISQIFRVTPKIRRFEQFKANELHSGLLLLQLVRGNFRVALRCTYGDKSIPGFSRMRIA